MIGMGTQAYSVTLAQPSDIPSFLGELQRVLNQANARAEHLLPAGASDILLIDVNDERARGIAQLLAQSHYHVLTAANSLDAFTRFLKETYIPVAILLGQEDARDQFFLQRLIQQVYLKYAWEIPVIRLRTQPLPPVTRPGHTTSPLQQTEQPVPLFLRSTSTNPRFPAAPPSTPWPEIRSRQQAGEQISLAGQNIGRYQVLSSLGGKDVHLVYDRMLEQQVAMKILRTNGIYYCRAEETQEKTSIFEKEGKLLEKIHHANIMPIINYGEAYISGFPFTYKAIRYSKEGSIADWMKQQNRVQLRTIEETVHVIMQVAHALQCLHDHHITYQNLKLSNLIIDETAKTLGWLNVQLADIALTVDGLSSFKTSSALAYRAPELWSGQASPASDQYSLAALAYELLTGHPLFVANTEHVLKRLQLSMSPPPPSSLNHNIPHSVDTVLLQALSKRPGDRFVSVAAFARAFEWYIKR